MATYADIVVRYVHPDDRSSAGDPSTARDFVKLEQIPWEPPAVDGFAAWHKSKYGSYMTEGLSWDQAMSRWKQYQSYACDDNLFEVEIRAHKSRNDLNYEMKASRGDFVPEGPTTGTEQKTESVNVSGSTYYEFTNLAVVSIECAEWEGDVIDEFGRLVLPKPTIQVKTGEYDQDSDDDYSTYVYLLFSEKVYGTLHVAYTIEYDTWFIQIDPRTAFDEPQKATAAAGAADLEELNEMSVSGEMEGAFGQTDCSSYYDEDELPTAYYATVRAIWDGGFDTLEVEVPEDLGTDCNPKTTTTSPDDEEEDEDKPKCYDLYVVRDKCTNEIISEEMVEVTCPEDETTEE